MFALRSKRQSTVQPEQLAAAWLVHRVGFGGAPGSVDEVASDLGGAVERVLEPDVAGVSPAPEPWDDADYAGIARNDVDAELIGRAVGDWLGAMVLGERQLLEQMTWFWHGHLVSGADKVRLPYPMVLQLRRFRRHALDGNLRDLLVEMVHDAAMLLYLDGATSVAGSPNENFSRELLELFALGIGNYTEADVQSGAVALTGVTLRPRRGDTEGTLVPRRHDDTPQHYLGVDGVHDPESVIDAVLAHDACGPYVARRVARHLLGPSIAREITDAWGRDFAAAGYRFPPLLRSVVGHGVEHVNELVPEVQGPLPWFVSAARALEIETIDRRFVRLLRGAGQLPMVPPNVAGWPRGDAWLSATAVVARANAAIALAAAASPQSVARKAAASGDDQELAWALGVHGFGDVSREAMASTTNPIERLAVALVCPEVVVR